MWFRVQIGWHIVEGLPQGPPPGLSCGNVGQMRSLHTIQYIWMYAHTCGCTPMDGCTSI